MGLTPYSAPADAGVLCVILVNTAISISIVKEIVRSILQVVGIRISSWEEFSVDTPQETIECRSSPPESRVEEFRNQTPTIRYDTVCCFNQQEHECPVCLTEFRQDSEINQLSCSHVFHKTCLEKWLEYWNFTCPVCRNQMMPAQEDGAEMCPT